MNKQKRFYIGTIVRVSAGKAVYPGAEGLHNPGMHEILRASCTVVCYLLHFLVQADTDRPQQMDPFDDGVSP